MKLLCVTVDEFMQRDPCKEEYPRERVSELFAERKSLTAIDVLDLDILVKDRFWVVLHESLIPARLLHTFACNEAELLLRAERLAGREPDPRSWAAIEAKRAWLRGEITDSELAIARAAAWAAKDVARAAAWAAGDVAGAAWVVAWATEATAGVAAWVVARVVARATAWATHPAAWTALDGQIIRLRELLGGQKGGEPASPEPPAAAKGGEA